MTIFRMRAFTTLVCAFLAPLAAESESLSSPVPVFAPSAPDRESIPPIGVQPRYVPVTPPITEMAIAPFTGKVRGTRVRLRTGADIESQVLQELDKGELLAVVGEKGDFYAVQAPVQSSAYIFRTFVLDDVVEGDRVNIRCEPDLHAAVIGHLSTGDRVEGSVCQEHPKWVKISIPASVHFYVAKEFVENIGGPEVKVRLEKRQTVAQQLLDHGLLAEKNEMRKSFEEIDIERLSCNYKQIISEYPEFPRLVEQARHAFVALQENYTQKRIAFLEAKAMMGVDESTLSAFQEEVMTTSEMMEGDGVCPTDRMLLWEPLEDALYLSWATLHEELDKEEFYEEQKALAVTLSGILEAYTAPVKNKPGDFILKNRDMPVGYLYSTRVNLQDLVGKKVTVLAVERPNNHFAFPAFYVLAQE